MQSENFDKKLKDSLSQRPPGNDKPEWEKMEPLLDKHLPVEKKDKRRIVFILFSFLLLSGGAFLIWQNNSGNKNDPAWTESREQNTNINGNKKAGNHTEKTQNRSEMSNTTTGQPASEKNDRIDQTHGAIVNNIPAKEPEIEVIAPRTSKNKKTNKSATKTVGRSFEKMDESAKNIEAEKTLNEVPAKIKTDPALAEKKEPSKDDEFAEPVTENKVAEQKQATKETTPVAVEKSNKTKQVNQSSFANNFFVTVSAGPDMSGVAGNAGKVQLAYGAGIGYQVSKKISVRAGFYAARKVYTADPEDYHPPYNFWAYYPNLKTIDANCKVYEIPVTVDYKISRNQKQSWFVSAGVSSLLMKEETYDYYFKPNSSPTYITYTRTIKNRNKHWFSVLNLSGGYTRVLNKNISLQAEPYVKLSMTGVGYGKVDLNSGGVLFSAIIKPFAKK